MRVVANSTTIPVIASYSFESCSIGDVIRSLRLIWELLEPDEMQNPIEPAHSLPIPLY